MSDHRPLRCTWLLLERVPPFLSAAFSADGLGSREGRTLIWGKSRRFLLSLSPRLARRLQRRYGLSGGCRNCGSSCRLLNQCPHWDEQHLQCSVYEDRPNTCRFFPITPADIRDRNIASARVPCGFGFASSLLPEIAPTGSAGPASGPQRAPGD